MRGFPNRRAMKAPKLELTPEQKKIAAELGRQGGLARAKNLTAMREHHVGEPLGEFATDLLVEIESDRDVLANLTESLGGSVGGPKEWSACC